MVAAKEEIRENLELMIERDGKIEDALVKGSQLKVASTNFKRRAK